MAWPKMIINGIIPKDTTEDEARAVAYTAWGCCYAGNTPPEHFGKVLASQFESVTQINCGKG